MRTNTTKRHLQNSKLANMRKWLKIWTYKPWIRWSCSRNYLSIRQTIQICQEAIWKQDLLFRSVLPAALKMFCFIHWREHVGPCPCQLTVVKNEIWKNLLHFLKYLNDDLTITTLRILTWPLSSSRPSNADHYLVNELWINHVGILNLFPCKALPEGIS